MQEQRLFELAPDAIVSRATWAPDGWTYLVTHRPNGSQQWDVCNQLVVARLSTPELLDVVEATWATRLRMG